MSPSRKTVPAGSALRADAEARLAVKLAQQKGGGGQTDAELLHELQVHQIELEIQNETLRQLQLALAESRDRYIDFYNFSPVGYVTLSDAGLILEINLTGATMLGKDRVNLYLRRFSASVAAEDTDRWHSYFIKALTATDNLSCELTLHRPDDSQLAVQIDSMRLALPGTAPELRLVLTDITERKQAERQLREMAASLEAQVLERTKELRRLAAQLTRTEERERRMLAQNLHDNLSQMLAVIRIKLSALSDGSDPDLIGKVAALTELVEQAERSARSVTLELSPPILHTLGFAAALEWLGEEIERLYGITVRVEIDLCQKSLGKETEAMLYRSARELLNNVAKHAGVKWASLSCVCDEDSLHLVVSDDGCGFDAADHGIGRPRQHSFGLSSIYERIVNSGGAMEVDSSAGNGTTVSLSLPCVVTEEESGDDPDRYR